MAILISAVSTPVFLGRTLVPSVLPLLILTAAGVGSINRKTVCGAAAAAVLLVLAFPSATLAVSEPEEKWDRLVLWLERHVEPGEEVWLLPNELVMPLSYAKGSAPLPFPVRGIPADFPAPNHSGPRYSGTRAVPGLTAEEAHRVVAEARGRRVSGVWIVSRFPRLFDPGDTLASSLRNDQLGERETYFAPILLQHYRLSPPFKANSAAPL
jgi:hypothetical protein